MSAVVAPVNPITVTDSTVEPRGGATVSGNFVVTSPSAAVTPVTVNGGSTFAIGTKNAQVVVSGGTNTQTIGIARDSAGNPLDMGGAVIQAKGQSGAMTVNLEGANIGGAKVNGAIEIPGSGKTLADVAPPGTFSGTPDTYVKTGSGNDQVAGTQGIDFIRTAKGDDSINAGAGSDIVRTGKGNDTVTLGKGDDVIYVKRGELKAGDYTKTVTDFGSEGKDKIQLDAAMKDDVSISGYGSKNLVIELSGPDGGTTTFASNGKAFEKDDVEFV